MDTPVVRIKRAQKEISEILKKYKVTLGTEMDFPMYRQLPIEVKLALKVIEKNGGNWIVRIQDAG